MRQFFTWGFWLSLLSLAGLTLLLLAIARPDPTIERVVAQATPPERRVDLIGMVFLAQADPGFAIVDGVTSGSMQIRVDGYRYMNIAPGTPGENRCAELAELASCAVAADLLGESVLWFSIVPLSPRNLVELPPITELLDGGKALLSNGWVVPHADVVKRVCDDDTTSLTDFIRRHGPASTTQYSLDDQAVVNVVCGVDDGTGTTSTTVLFTPAATIAPVPVSLPGATLPVGSLPPPVATSLPAVTAPTGTAPTSPITGAPTSSLP
jgi:hypothetical protein